MMPSLEGEAASSLATVILGLNCSAYMIGHCGSHSLIVVHNQESLVATYAKLEQYCYY
jgi:hypothetical protein